MSTAIFNCILAFSSIASVSFGAVVFYKNIASRLHLLFLLFTIAIGIWLFGTFKMFTATNDTLVIFWDRFVYIGIIFVPVLLYHFGLSFTGIKQTKTLIIGYVLGLFFLIISRTAYFVDDIFRYSWGLHTRAQFFHHLFLIDFAAYCIFFYLHIYKFYNSSTSAIRREQAKYIFLAFFILIVFGSIAYLPAYGIPILPFPYFASLVFLMILGYAITRHRLMDIRVVLKKSLAYGGTVALILCAFLGAVVVVYQKIPSLAVWVIAMLLVILFQNRIKGKVKHMLDGIFFLDELDFSQQLRRLETSQELQSFVEEAIEGIQKVVPVCVVDMFICERHHYRYTSVLGSRNTPVAFDDEVLDILHNWQTGLVSLDELAHQKHPDAIKLTKFLKKHHGHFMMRLGNILGIVILTAKKDNTSYNAHELQQLEYIRAFTTRTLSQLLHWQDTLERTNIVLHERKYTQT